MKKRSTPCAAIVVALTAALAACATTTHVTSPPAEVSAGRAASTTTAAQLEPTPAGFRRVVRDGEEYFCQTRAVTGSRARAVEVCMTRDEIRRMEEINEEYRRNAANAGSQSTMKLDSPQ
jgi:hypothetical protein